MVSKWVTSRSFSFSLEAHSDRMREKKRKRMSTETHYKERGFVLSSFCFQCSMSVEPDEWQRAQHMHLWKWKRARPASFISWNILPAHLHFPLIQIYVSSGMHRYMLCMCSRNARQRRWTQRTATVAFQTRSEISFCVCVVCVCLFCFFFHLLSQRQLLTASGLEFEQNEPERIEKNKATNLTFYVPLIVVCLLYLHN